MRAHTAQSNFVHTIAIQFPQCSQEKLAPIYIANSTHIHPTTWLSVIGEMLAFSGCQIEYE